MRGDGFVILVSEENPRRGGECRRRKTRRNFSHGERGRDPVYDGRQQLDNCLSNPQCIFLFIVLAMMMLKILIQSASILPFLHPFVQINPANKFLHLASNLQSQFNWSKQLSIKSGEEEVVGPAAAGWAGALILMGR